MTEYALKLSPIVKENELIAMGFVKSLGKFFGGFEEKKGVQVCLAIDFESKLCWLGLDNDNTSEPEAIYFDDDNGEACEFFEADDVRKRYEFDLDFEIPQVLLQMLMHGLVHIEKKEGN